MVSSLVNVASKLWRAIQRVRTEEDRRDQEYSTRQVSPKISAQNLNILRSTRWLYLVERNAIVFVCVIGFHRCLHSSINFEHVHCAFEFSARAYLAAANSFAKAHPFHIFEKIFKLQDEAS